MTTTHILRRERGWKQCDLARRAGISQQLLSLIENGYVPKRGNALKRLAVALGVPASSLFDNQEDRP